MLNIEPIIDAIKSILTDELPAEIAAENDRHTDFALEDIQAVYVEGSDGDGATPCLILVEREPSELALGSEWGAYAYSVEVYVSDIDLSAETLNRKLWRYRECVARVLMRHQAEPDNAGSTWYMVRKTAADPQPLLYETDALGNRTGRLGRAKGVRFLFGSTEDPTQA